MCSVAVQGGGVSGQRLRGRSYTAVGLCQTARPADRREAECGSVSVVLKGHGQRSAGKIHYFPRPYLLRVSWLQPDRS